MKQMKLQFLFLAFCCIALSAFAKVISPAEALNRVAGNEHRLMSAADPYTPELIKTEFANNLPTAYIYTTENNDFLILSADDQAEAILAYGSNFDNAINPAMQWLLDEYSKEIESIRKNAHRVQSVLQHTDREAIHPMITTKWNQSSPFNDMCPKLNGLHCVAGCVATAMAQVINYHKPSLGNGMKTASYKWNGQTLSFDFANESFDWQNMLDSYDESASEIQQQAVAKLIYACGVSVSMDYGVYVSSAYRNNIAKALIDNFGFDKSIHLEQRIYYSAHDWNNFIYSQLSESGPILLRGANDSAGHMFVCDGYSSDGFFHINWGWGGQSDGYFKLSALNPKDQGIGGSASGYNANLEAIVNIKPQQSGSSYHQEITAAERLKVTVASAELGDVITLTGGFYNQGANKLSCSIGLIAENINTGKSSTITFFNSILQPLTTYNQFNFTLPVSMNDGVYRIYPAWKTTEMNWTKMRVNALYPGYVNMTISGGMVYFSSDNGAQITMSDINLDTPIILGHNTTIEGTIENSSEYDYYGAIFAELISPDNNTPIAFSATTNVEVEAGTSTIINFATSFTRYDNTSLEPGEYTLIVVNQDRQDISSGIPVKVINAPAENGNIRATSLEYIGNSNNADKDNLQFSATIESLDGDFFGEVYLWVFSATNYGYSTIGSLPSQVIYIENGKSISKIFSGAMPSLTEGVQYCAALYRGSSYLSDLCYFKIGETSSIDHIETGNRIVSRQYYSPTGIKVSEDILQSGMYIVIESMENGQVIISKKSITR